MILGALAFVAAMVIPVVAMAGTFSEILRVAGAAMDDGEPPPVAPPATSSSAPGSPTSSDAVDVCALVTPAETEPLMSRQPHDTEPMAVTARTVEVDTGVPLDICHYNAGRASIMSLDISTVSVTVSAIPRTSRNVLHGDPEPVPNLGDEAYLQAGTATTEVMVRRGDAQLVVKVINPTLATAKASHREAVLTLARTAVSRLPSNVAVAGPVADGLCAQLNNAPIAATLAQPIALSRRFESDYGVMCVYSATHDAQVRIFLERAASESRTRITGMAARNLGMKLREPGLDAVWVYGQIFAFSGDRMLSIEVDGIDGARSTRDGPSAEEVALTKEAARVFFD
ncbi:hypothetical protein [Actinopolymorpha alba]|uniref:hypothetical protein n=1 Tax=Actinopolymorpha alba TaxID=533267 RepID=UPI0012F6AEC0|nr:hypothetical protein [Actinopolymorpha alba]